MKWNMVFNLRICEGCIYFRRQLQVTRKKKVAAQGCGVCCRMKHDYKDVWMYVSFKEHTLLSYLEEEMTAVT